MTDWAAEPEYGAELEPERPTRRFKLDMRTEIRAALKEMLVQPDYRAEVQAALSDLLGDPQVAARLKGPPGPQGPGVIAGGGGGGLTIGGVPVNSLAAGSNVTLTTSGGQGTIVASSSFYAQGTDPGAVGAGSVWKNTTTELWYERNDANTGWDAYALVTVTATGAALAHAPHQAFSVDGSADTSRGATATGNGDADVAGLAASTTGNATANSSATATSGDASARASATAGSGAADVAATATTTSGDATSGASSLTTTGTAYTALFAERGAVSVSIELNVTDTLKQIIVLGLPTADPAVAGQLWNSTGTVKVSAG